MDIKTKTIEEITDVLIDYRGHTPPKTTSGIWLITAKVIKDGFVIDGAREYISEEFYPKWMTRGFPKQWDILMTTEAPLGEVAQLRTTEKIALAQRIILLRGNPEIIDQQYYFHAFKSPFVQAELMKRATGTTVLGIKQSELRQVKVPVPPLPIQRRIADILSAYDDLIENNTRRIRILVGMAQMIYKEWLGNFDKDSQLADGWEKISYSDLLESYSGGDWGEEQPDEKENCPAMIIRGTDFPEVRNGGQIKAPTRYISKTSLERRGLKAGDIIVENSVNASSRCVGTTLLITEGILKRIGENSICASFCKNFRLKDSSLAPLVYLHMRFLYEENLMPFYQNVAANGIGNFQAERFVNSEYIFVPKDKTRLKEILETFTTLTSSTLADQIANLRQTRDLLLPRLVGGEVEV